MRLPAHIVIYSLSNTKQLYIKCACFFSPILQRPFSAKIISWHVPKILFILLLSFSCTAQSYNYYFGNLHAHTSYSDGNKDSVSSGISGPAESYNYAKLSNNFDFLGISEHNHYSTLRNPGFKRALYQPGLRCADSLNDDGNFLTLFGMEYGVSSSNNGHVLIYGSKQLIGWESNVGGGTGPNYDIFNGKSDYAALFQKLKNNDSCFALLAHPYWTDFTTYGTDSTALAFAPYNAGFDSAIVGMPLRSGNAFSTFDNYGDYSPQNYFNYYKKMLNQGYHLGIGYDHDNHYSNFGRSNGGRLVVLMPQLSRNNLYAAMKAMRFYGSDDSNAQLDFKMNNKVMGSIFTDDAYPTISLLHTDPDGEQADTIRIWKGYKGSGAWAYTVQEVVNANSAVYYDTQIQKGKEYYYFAELRQKDGQWMVTSPIWYTGGTLLSTAAANETSKPSIYYDAGTQQISILSQANSINEIKLFDISGNLILMGNSDIRTITLENLAKGYYTLQLRAGSKNYCFKIVH